MKPVFHFWGQFFYLLVYHHELSLPWKIPPAHSRDWELWHSAYPAPGGLTSTFLEYGERDFSALVEGELWPSSFRNLVWKSMYKYYSHGTELPIINDHIKGINHIEKVNLKKGREFLPQDAAISFPKTLAVLLNHFQTCWPQEKRNTLILYLIIDPDEKRQRSWVVVLTFMNFSHEGKNIERLLWHVIYENESPMRFYQLLPPQVKIEIRLC